MTKIETKAGGLTRRRFIHTCALGVGGCFLGSLGLEALETLAGRNAPEWMAADELWKWSKEALFYVKTQSGILCQKCPNFCTLVKGETGKCRNRVNHIDKLYSTAYGNPCAVHIDPIEKKPLFHFLPSTRAFSIAAAGCNLACLNCQNWQISQVSPKETINEDLMPDKVVELCLRSGSESIAYTYSEPTTFYEYAFDTAKLARARGIRNVWKSNGYINETPLRKLSKVLDAANIDLKSFDDTIYAKLSRGKLAPILRTLRILKEEGVWLEITNLVVPSWTDDLDMIERMCDWLVRNGLEDCPLHFSRFMPLYKLTHLPSTPTSVLEKARDIALRVGVKYSYVGNVPGHAAENTYCHKCKKMIIERKGFVIITNAVSGGKCKHCGEKIPGVWG
jgi:pyruvate formate lyase activating enzyme